jgi:hypothetical protein
MSDGDSKMVRCHDVSILAVMLRRGGAQADRFGSFLDLLLVRVELLNFWLECEQR